MRERGREKLEQGRRLARAGPDISARLAKASQAFGRLSKRLWDDHGIRLDTKISVYVAAILPVLLYGCESWTLYRRNIRKLDQFHMRCLYAESPMYAGRTRSRILKFYRSVA